MNNENPDSNTAVKVKIVHLQDSTGKVQAIFPFDSMLDIASITRVSKRRLAPTNTYNVDSDALLSTDKTITYIDKSLKEHGRLTLKKSEKSGFSAITPIEINKIFSGMHCQFGAFSIARDQLEKEIEHHDLDEKCMLEALGRFQSIRLRQRLEETLELPPLPASSQRIIRLCANEKAGTDELCNVISLDPSLAAQVVSWASSPYYGAPGEIESVEDAIIRVLGFDMVMNLALGLSMGKALAVPENGPRHYDSYWFEAVSFASLMEAMVKKMPAKKRPRLGHAYLAGLLHNFGLLAIGAVLPPHFSILSRHLEVNAHLPTNLVEMHLLKLSREQIGAWLLRHWALPDGICNGIRYSKNLDYDGENAIIARMLSVCHNLLNKDDIPQASQDMIGLDQNQLQAIYQDLKDNSDNIKLMVSLINGN
ncbi:histidine kinase [Marinomonas sp. 42_23_T18]|nr:histidine kinase [Marinomonas sp. 42_23_T18]